jgi:hypothetical protein
LLSVIAGITKYRASAMPTAASAATIQKIRRPRRDSLRTRNAGISVRPGRGS